MATFPRVTSQLPDYIGLLPSWKGQHIVLTRTDIYSGYGFFFPTCSASAKTIICGLKEYPIHHHAFPHGITSDQGHHCTANEVW